MLAGFLSIIHAASGHFILSAQLIMLSMILDGFDGNIARLLKGTSRFGGEFDTYVDIMSFGIAPALLSYWYVFHDKGLLGLLLCSAMVLFGMARLSRFRVADPFRGLHGYVGLPITVNAGWIALLVYIVESQGGGWMNLHQGPMAVVAWTVSMLFVFLQVSNLHYTKPAKHWIFIIPSALLILVMFLDMKVGASAAFGMCLYGLFYAFISPFLPRHTMEALPEELEDSEAEVEA